MAIQNEMEGQASLTILGFGMITNNLFAIAYLQRQYVQSSLIDHEFS